MVIMSASFFHGATLKVCDSKYGSKKKKTNAKKPQKQNTKLQYGEGSLYCNVGVGIVPVNVPLKFAFRKNESFGEATKEEKQHSQHVNVAVL